MRALSWLRDLISSERGNVFVVAAAVMPLLLGSAAFAVDTIQLSVWKRQLQRAADSGSIAGAYAVSLGDNTHDAVHRDLDKNAFPLLTQEEDIVEGARLGFDRTVRVTLTATRELPFMSIFTQRPTTLVADATAALVGTGEFCMVSLYDGTDTGIDANGGADIDLSCGMKSNCTGAACVTAGGSSSIRAAPIASVGGLDGDKNNFVQPTTLQPHSAVQRDPFAYLPNPTKPPEGCSASPLTESTVFTDKAHQCFTSANVSPSATLNIPAHVETITIWGGDIDFKGDVNGTGVTFVMSGDNGQAGDLIINSQANLNLSSPGDGTYKGVLFYRDRRASNIEIKINGGAESHLTGALYFPSSDITYAGNSEMDVECLQMVGQKLKFRGGARITNVCDEDSGASAFNQTIVRLVG
ncbi:MAG TPA: pilus assembly protein TadG-related protein [Allosphingosinicella sp.]|nr:pilus assembly protein TadG-related protein [Allosphingosinicella sp.]